MTKSCMGGQRMGPLLSGKLMPLRRRPREIQLKNFSFAPEINTGEPPIPSSCVIARRFLNSARNHPAHSGTTGRPRRSESSIEVLQRLFLQINKQVKWLVPAPAVRLKVPVQSENVSGVQLIRQMDETRIGKIRGQVAILAHDTPHRCCGLRQLKWNREDTVLNVLEYSLGSPRKFSQQVAAFCDDRLASNEGPFQRFDGIHTSCVMLLAPIQKGDDHAGIQEYRLHRPKPSSRFLLEPRSGMPEANRPTPTIFLWDGAP